MRNITHCTNAVIRCCCLLSLLLLPGFLATAQFSVSANKTATQLSNTLLGASSGITISNPVLNCPSSANGTYTNIPNATLSVGDGILLTSGSAANVNNPATFFEDTNNGAGGDANLTALSGNTTLDACVLEFDFVPQGDSIKFRYQFGSEEYPDYTCTQFNDVFGFFISGPGYGSPTNIALVPGTTIPVAINSVNAGSPTGQGVLSNCTGMGPGSPFSAYFINHAGSGNRPVYDGYTTTFNAGAKVTPCGNYHLKLGVADATDRRLSSGVFIESGSLSILPPVITGCPANIIQNTGVNASTCGAAVSWTPPTVNNSCLNVTSSSSHTPGTVFPVGTTQVTYSFTNAGGTSTCTFNVTVADNAPPVASCQNYVLNLASGSGTVTAANINNGSTDNCGIVSMIVSPNTFTCADTGMHTVTLTVTDAAGNSDTCKANVTVISPACNIAITPSNNIYTGGIPNNIYLGYGPQSATLTANGGSGTYSWSPSANLSCSSCQNPVFTPTLPGTYTYTVTITYANGCKTSCSVTLCVKEVRVNGYQGRAVWVCHKTPANPLGLNQIVLLAAVPTHIGPHPNDFLGRCDQVCPPEYGTDMKPAAGLVSITGTGDLMISAYPNPFTDELHLKIGSNTTTPVDVLIYDLAGKKLQAITGQKVDSDIVIGAQLTSGIYFIDVRQGKLSQRARIVKIK